MNVVRRVRKIERDLCSCPTKTLFVMANRMNDAAMRARIERAQSRRWSIRVIRFATRSPVAVSVGDRIATSHAETHP
jgi:hypothetical protein